MYYADEPITQPEEDSLGRDVFVRNLANDIKQWSGAGSLVLALYGPWGTGKSSVLNLLKKKITENKTGEIISFDPWYFNSTEQLIQTFFAVVKNKTLESAQGKTKDNLNDAFKKYSTSLSQNISWEPTFELPGGFKINFGELKKNKQDLESPEIVREVLRQTLLKINSRFIVLIDNLDRLDPPELMLMFKLVRLCSDFPNFVFVLAFDHEQVRKLVMTQGVDPDFLDKIIQIDIELPLIDQNDIDSFFGDNLLDIISNLNLRLNQDSRDRFSTFYYRAMSNNLINNLRMAKRYLNSIKFSFPLVMEDVDFADFLILEALRVFFPEIYSGLPGYKKDLTSFDSEYGSLDSIGKVRKSIYQDIREWIEKELIDKNDIQVCEELIGFLFPTIQAYFQNPSKPSIITIQDSFIANQRICISTYFDVYFKFRLPKSEISSRIINTIEDELNTLDEEGIEGVISLMLNEKERFPQLLSKLFYRVHNLNISGRVTLINILGRLGTILEWNLLSSIKPSSGPNAVRVIIKCMEWFEKNLEIQNAIKNVVTSTDSLPLASELTSKFLSRDYRIQISQIEKDALKAIMIERLHKELLDNKQNIFSTYPTSYYRILNIWRSDQILGEREIATNYVYDYLPLDASVLPKILISYATFDTGKYELQGFEFDKLQKDYDLDMLNAAFDKHKSTANYSQMEQEVIDAFKKAMITENNLIEGST